jgi:hypothetical protein
MSATTGTIGAGGSHRLVRFYWLTALVLAGLLLIAGAWAFGRSEARSQPTTPKPQPSYVVPRGPSSPAGAMGDSASSGVRYGPSGEAFPRPSSGGGS